MAVRIRLKRTGRRKRPSYRVVVADSRSPRDGRLLEDIGYYGPLLPQEKRVSIKVDRLQYWVSCGAQMSDRVSFLYKKISDAA